VSISHWPESERPREKLISQGCESLSDAELLALILRHGRKGHSAVDLSRELLSHFGGLRELLEADQHSLCSQPGLGQARYAELKACLELGRRYRQASLKRGVAIGGPEDTLEFLEARLRSYHQEVFACLFLDVRHRVIRFEELFKGTIDGASVYPRELVKRALHYNAAALIVAHNHPSGIADPSRSDRSLTRRLQQAVELVDIRLLDHVVIGDGESVSFANRGWL
jgi:DNA repair protein RadC